MDVDSVLRASTTMIFCDFFEYHPIPSIIVHPRLISELMWLATSSYLLVKIKN